MNDLMGHPVYGASFEGYVIENILLNLPRWQPYFYRTAGGAELDLVLVKGAEIAAVEIKASSVPKPSRGFWSSCEDNGATRKFVVGTVEKGYPIKMVHLCATPSELIEAM